MGKQSRGVGTAIFAIDVAGMRVAAENMQSHLLFLRRQQRNSLIKLLLTADKLEKSCRTTTNRISTQQKLTRRLNGHNRGKPMENAAHGITQAT